MLFDVFPSNFSHAMYGVSLRFYQQEFLHLSHVWSDILIFPRNSLSPSLVIHKERLCPEEQPWDNQDTYYSLTLRSGQLNFDIKEWSIFEDGRDPPSIVRSPPPWHFW